MYESLSIQTVQNVLPLAYGRSERLPGGMRSPSGRMWNLLRSSCNRSSRSQVDLSPQGTSNLRNRVSSFLMPVGQNPYGIWMETDCSISSRRAPRRLRKESSSCGPSAAPQSTTVARKSQSGRLSSLNWRGSLAAHSVLSPIPQN